MCVHICSVIVCMQEVAHSPCSIHHQVDAGCDGEWVDGAAVAVPPAILPVHKLSVAWGIIVPEAEAGGQVRRQAGGRQGV